MKDNNFDGYDNDKLVTYPWTICMIVVGLIAGMLLTLIIQEIRNVNTILEIRQADKVFYSRSMPELQHNGLYRFYDFNKNQDVTIVGCFYVIEVLEINEKGE